MSSIPHNMGTGFMVNGELLTAAQTYQRSQMYDALYQYYFARYNHACCTSTDNPEDKSFHHKITKATTARFAELQEMYRRDIGQEPPC